MYAERHAVLTVKHARKTRSVQALRFLNALVAITLWLAPGCDSNGGSDTVSSLDSNVPRLRKAIGIGPILAPCGNGSCKAR